MTQKNQINLANLTATELASLIKEAQGFLDQKKAVEVARLKADFEGQLSQLNLSLADVYPTGKVKGHAKASASLEAPEKGATYANPANPDETWTAGVKKGRAPAWVTDLREAGNLHKHKV